MPVGIFVPSKKKATVKRRGRLITITALVEPSPIAKIVIPTGASALSANAQRRDRGNTLN